MMQMFGIIYKATNMINGKVYIGQTTMKPSKRWAVHKCDAISRNSHNIFHKAIRKYGWDNFKWEIIDEAVNREDLNNKEIYWIGQYDSHNYSKGYNMAVGYGQGAVWYGRHHTDETKGKISKANKGNLHSNETKDKISKSRIGKYGNENNPRAKAVIQLSLNDEYMNEFRTAKQASEATGCHRQNITKCCKGKLKMTGGFKWVYKDKYLEE